MKTEPLRITAHLDNAMTYSSPIHLCSLLQARVAARERLQPPITESECVDLDIPIQRSGCGRFFLCTVGYADVAHYECEHIHRYFPIHEAVRRTTLKRVDLGAGTSKIFRVPIEKKMLVGGRMHWWCVGDREGIESLLAHTLYLGRGRSRGAGKIAFWRGRWNVEPCEPWPGFPCVSVEGDAMRNLPLDYPGLVNFETDYSRVTGPFWASWGREECAVPARSR